MTGNDTEWQEIIRNYNLMTRMSRNDREWREMTGNDREGQELLGNAWHSNERQRTTKIYN